MVAERHKPPVPEIAYLVLPLKLATKQVKLLREEITEEVQEKPGAGCLKAGRPRLNSASDGQFGASVMVQPRAARARKFRVRLRTTASFFQVETRYRENHFGVAAWPQGNGSLLTVNLRGDQLSGVRLGRCR
jgi:hypothetical protein